jgi:plastocyanin
VFEEFLGEQQNATRFMERATITEFEGGADPESLDLSLTHLETSLGAADSGLEIYSRLISTTASEEMLPEFVETLQRMLEDAGPLERTELVSDSPIRLVDLQGILEAQREDFQQLRDLTAVAVEQFREVLPEANEGRFAHTLLSGEAEFAATFDRLGIARADFARFYTRSCAITIEAFMEIYPQFPLVEASGARDSAEVGDSGIPEAGANAGGSATERTLGLYDIYFDPTEMTVPSNTDVQLSLPNFGEAPHNFTIDGLNVSVDVASGEIKEVTINAPPGRYEYYCDVPGHRPGGMVGTLLVQ